MQELPSEIIGDRRVCLVAALCPFRRGMRWIGDP
jgi:hypothetical protein